jgi:hypothetical protein
LSADDIVYCLQVFYKTNASFGTGTYQHFLKPYKKSKKKMMGGDCLRLQIVNTDDKGSGIHWVLAAGVVNERWINTWDPKSTKTYMKNFTKDAAKVIDRQNFTVYHTGLQKEDDGWRCGYFVVHWWLGLTRLVEQADISLRQHTMMEDIPKWWCPVIWSLLRLRDLVRE